MAALRILYDGVVILAFTISGICIYYQHYSYDYSTHPLTIITCKVVAILLTVLSMNLLFSSFVNNLMYIIHMKDVGFNRYLIEESFGNVPANYQLPNVSENNENALIDNENNIDDLGKEEENVAVSGVKKGNVEGAEVKEGIAEEGKVEGSGVREEIEGAGAKGGMVEAK